MTPEPRAEWIALLQRLHPRVAQDRIMTSFIVAHPDDEVIGAGATLLPHVRPCRIVHVTDGAPDDLRDAHAVGCDTREAYALRRRDEALAALALAGIEPGAMVDLGIRDQQASYAMAAIARRLATLLEADAASIVVTQPYEGGHPDHDATAFAVHGACRLLARKGRPVPIVEMTSYHRCGDTTVHSAFLPLEGARSSCLAFDLTPNEQRLKRDMFARFVSQRDVLRWFPLAHERFRVAPEYDFTQPPHDGTLNYEHYDWGMTGAKWRDLARAALVDLA